MSYTRLLSILYNVFFARNYRCCFSRTWQLVVCVYRNDFGGSPNKQSFKHKSGKPQTIRQNLENMHRSRGDNDQAILGATANNDMLINASKSKEMIIGSLDSINLSPLSTSSGTVERVATFKLLGIHLDTNVSWSVHINSVIPKASKRLYFWNSLREREFHKTSFSISIPQ